MMVLSDRHPAFAEALGDLSALGVVENHHRGVAFGVIGARSNPRWLILPVGDRKQARSGLDLFQPASASARIAKLGAATFCRMGLQRLVLRRRLHLAGVDALAAWLHGGASACAIFTGTDGPHRKTTIQLMETGGGILGYAKLTRRDPVRFYLAHEARMLRHVEGLKLASADTPALLAFEPGEGSAPSVLVTDSRKTTGHMSPREPGPAHLRFLAELAQRTAGIGAEGSCGDLAAFASDPRLPAAWASRFRNGVERLKPLASAMPVALAHGDFTPWNSFVLGERLYVFDWEYAAEDWPLGYDLAHYVLAGADMRAPEAAIAKLVPLLADVFHRGDASAAKDALLLSLLLHAGFYLRREFDAGGDAQGWSAGANRGALIDLLLGRGRG